MNKRFDPKKFRASFTVLNLWTTNRYEDAVRTYFKLESYTTPQMEEGKKYHKKWATYIDKHGQMPKLFGSHKLKLPVTEKKHVVAVYDWLDLVFIADLIHNNSILTEFKTGKTTSSKYLNTGQLDLYALGLLFKNIVITKAEVYHYDQYREKTDYSFKWITDANIKASLNWLETNAGEMYEYLQKNDLFNKFNN